MKKLLFMTFAILGIGISCTKEIGETSGLNPEQQVLSEKLVGDSTGEIIKGTILVKLDSPTSSELRSGKTKEISDVIFGNLEINSITPAIPAFPKNTKIAEKYGLHQWFSITFDESTRPESMAAKLASIPEVRSIQYSRHIEPVRAEKAYPFEGITLTKASEENPEGFNDPYASHQWNLHNDGTAGKDAVAGADISVKDAWRLTGGDPSVVVAIFDCAVAYRHEDLADAVWRNEKEISGKDDVDDDGNGFIDDKYGFNFTKCYTISPEYIEGKLDGQSQPAIDSQPINSNNGIGHGTHVAGIIGATNGNGKGISSIAGGTGNGDGVRLMTCQIFDGSAASTDAQGAAAFIYAADNGACIAQCSYGTSYIITDDDLYINGGKISVDGKEIDLEGSPLETAALLYFLDPENSNHKSLKGNIAVFAAGNHSNPYSIYPGALPYVLSVTAFGYDWLPGGYTNYGPGCNISAPGGEWKGVMGEYGGMILSTGLPCSVDGGYPGLDTGKGESKNYVYMQGTSMACPHVSGVLALGISYADKLGKTFTRDEMTSLLLTSVNDIEQYNDGGMRRFYPPFSTTQAEDINMSRFYGQMGTGAIDAWKFLMAIEGTPSVMVKAGEKTVIDLDDYFGEGVAEKHECTITIDDASSSSLGLTSKPVVKNGKLELTCANIGSGKITITSATNNKGVETGVAHSIGNMAFSREISIVSRPYASSNGGWF